MLYHYCNTNVGIPVLPNSSLVSTISRMVGIFVLLKNTTNARFENHFSSSSGLLFPLFVVSILQSLLFYIYIVWFWCCVSYLDLHMFLSFNFCLHLFVFDKLWTIVHQLPLYCLLFQLSLSGLNDRLFLALITRTINNNSSTILHLKQGNPLTVIHWN